MATMHFQNRWRKTVMVGLGCAFFGPSLGAQVELDVPPQDNVLAVARPSVRVNLPLFVNTGETVPFEIRVHSPSGNPVDVTLLNPVPGMVVPPMKQVSSGARRSAQWIVTDAEGGFHDFQFLVTDSVHPEVRAKKSVEVHVLGESSHSAMTVGDVTGDGILDVVAIAHYVDQGPVLDTGALYVWEGGASPASTPTNKLTVPGAAAEDCLSYTRGAPGLQLRDITGDGVKDVVVASSIADHLGVEDLGAIYVWTGGPSLRKKTTPDATLHVPGIGEDSELGSLPNGLGVLLVDFTDDGIVDVLALSQRAEVNGRPETGAVYLWKGGQGVRGSVEPDAEFTLINGTMERLGNSSKQGMQLVDVNQDGHRDLVVASESSDHAKSDSGGIYLWWGGGDYSGTHLPDVIFVVDNPADNDGLGKTSGLGYRFADVTGDGHLDLVAGASQADVRVPPRSNQGLLFVWKGPTWSGNTKEDACLEILNGNDSDQLCHVFEGEGFLVEDFTGDGVADIFACAPGAKVQTKEDAGRAYLWKAANFLGRTDSDVTFRADETFADDELGDLDNGQYLDRNGFRMADIDADGILDIIGGASNKDFTGLTDVGGVFVWYGHDFVVDGPALYPSASLETANPSNGDKLGQAGLQIADVTGDGHPDIISGSRYIDAGEVDSGALCVWAGGPGNPQSSPTAMLIPGSGGANAALGNVLSYGLDFRTGDVNGDGIGDVIAAAPLADVELETESGTTVVSDAGAVFVWYGGPSLHGEQAAHATLRLDSPTTLDRLGYPGFEPFGGGEGLWISDVTDDGILDIVVMSKYHDFQGIADAGVIAVFAGGSLSGDTTPTATLGNPNAQVCDELGEAAGQGFQIFDFTGDGILDLVAAASSADVAAMNGGALYLWPGPLTNSTPPTVVFFDPNASAEDQLGL